MKIKILVLILLSVTNLYHCQHIKEIFEDINKQTEKFNAVAAEITWESSVRPGNPELVYRSDVFQKKNVEWTQKICKELERFDERRLLNSTQLRQKYLLCRGPKYTVDEARLITNLYQELQSIYTEVQVCIPAEETTTTKNLDKADNAISIYFKKVDHFYKTVYRWPDTSMIAIKDAISDKLEEENKEGETKKELCLRGEEDFQKMMAFSKKEDVLKWVWSVWREKVGPPMKEPYRRLVQMENVAARRNGYSDIGASWREELEIPYLRLKCRSLFEDIQPLYKKLHGVVRFYLRRRFGRVVPEHGPIPAHLLGDLWSQNWQHLSDMIVSSAVDLDESIKKLNWTVHDMVRRAADFYQSLGLPSMTQTFWEKSVFTKGNNTRCHGTAADMFKQGDFRLIYCSGTTMEDFYVFHHELGHIQYYMAYEHQPTLFRQANMALHEAIGDTIMYAVMTPQHLHRLRLINDTLLYNSDLLADDDDDEVVSVEHKSIEKVKRIKCNHCKDTKEDSLDDNLNVFEAKVENNEDIGVDENNKEAKFHEEIDLTTDKILLLKQSLNKLPQIPFALLIEEYRWKYFEGGITDFNLNDAFWRMAEEIQGIAPPMGRGAYEFDIGAKYHVPDNTPYVRYFLSSFLQSQLFESLCKAAVYGRRGVKDPLPKTITLNRCDLYGSKVVGKILRDIMSRGHSQHWRQILQETIGQDDISAASLLRYYRPLQSVLDKLIRKHRIPIGW